MGTTISKTQLLAELNNENAYWQALLDDIGEANMTQPEVAGGWSIKDIVAHLTGWRRRTGRDARIITHPGQLVRERQCPRTTCPGAVIAEAGFRQPASLSW